jgi:Sel1 repeat
MLGVGVLAVNRYRVIHWRFVNRTRVGNMKKTRQVLVKALAPALALCALPQILAAQNFYGDELIYAASPERARLRETAQRRGFKEMLAKANAGDARAQLRVARAYELGQGTAKDAANALMWHTKAAEGGERFAALSAASYYVAGRDVPANAIEAERWLKKYQALGGKYPCVRIASDSLKDDARVNASLCTIAHYWRQYAFRPRPAYSGSASEYAVTLGLNFAQKSVVVLDGNMPDELKAQAEKALINTIELIPVPKALAVADETIPFPFRFKVEPEGKRAFRITMLHWED